MNGFQAGFSGLPEDLCKRNKRAQDVHYNPFAAHVSVKVPQ